MTSTLDHVDVLLEFPDAHPYRKLLRDALAVRGARRWTLRFPQFASRPGLIRKLRGSRQPSPTLLTGASAGCPSPRFDRGQCGVRLCRLGFAQIRAPAVSRGANRVAEWPDGGWNCDRHRTAHRSSFHESITRPSDGHLRPPDLRRRCSRRGRPDRRASAEHRLFRVHGTGEPIHPSWTKLHYPPYWHYDMLQGLRLLRAVNRLNDHRASDDLDLLESSRRREENLLRPSMVIQEPAGRAGSGYVWPNADTTSRGDPGGVRTVNRHEP